MHARKAAIRGALPAVVSVNTGSPRTLIWRGREIETGIFKAPVDGPVRVRPTGLEGDGQADSQHHGGPLKAVYAYPAEHYAWWRGQLGELPAGWGVFGENLTVNGLVESEVGVGDLLTAGEVRLRVTEPRSPCFKLGIRLQRTDIVSRFVEANRPGFYCAIEEPGELRAGDRITVEPRRGSVSIAELMRLRLLSGPNDRAALQAALEVDAITDSWRRHLGARLARLEWRSS